MVFDTFGWENREMRSEKEIRDLLGIRRFQLEKHPNDARIQDAIWHLEWALENKEDDEARNRAVFGDSEK